MLVILLFLIAGILLGLFLRHRDGLIKKADSLTTWTIYLLLFTLGVSIGTNPEIMDNLGMLGFEGLVLTIGAVAGSIAVSYVVFRLFFGGRHEK